MSVDVRFWPIKTIPALKKIYNGSSEGPGAMVKAACLKNPRSQVQTPLWHSSFKETKCFFPALSQKFNIMGSLRDREVASSASDRQDFASCVCNHLTILRSFSWPSLVYKCSMVVQNPIYSFIHSFWAMKNDGISTLPPNPSTFNSRPLTPQPSAILDQHYHLHHSI